MPTDYLSVTETAKHFNTTRPVIQHKIKSGYLKAVRIGKQWAIPREELSGWVKVPFGSRQWLIKKTFKAS